MSGRRGRPLEAVAAGLLETSPAAVYLWLLRTSRMANPDPAVHTQSRFGLGLGRDGSFVSHVEAGRRPIPSELRDRWFAAVGLDAAAVADYLATAGQQVRTHIVEASNVSNGMRHLDEALDGAELTPSQWVSASGAAATLRMPKTVQRFVRLAADAMAFSHGPDYRIAASALLRLPPEFVVRSIRASIDEIPSRGYHAVDVLGGMDSAYSGPVLREYFQAMPDPWLERSVLEAMRRLVERGEVASLSDNPQRLQETIVGSIADNPSWTVQVELANLARVLGPLPPALHRQLGDYPDLDVRVAAGARPDEAAVNAVRLLRTDAVLATVDRMYGSATSDPLADKLVGVMMLGRTKRSRMEAAQALALGPYGQPCIDVLAQLARSESPEVRRATAQALQRFPRSETAARTLVSLSLHDIDANVRARAVWSLMTHHEQVYHDTINTMLQDPSPVVRRCAVDLADAAGHSDGVRQATRDADMSIVRDAVLMDGRRGNVIHQCQ